MVIHKQLTLLSLLPPLSPTTEEATALAENANGKELAKNDVEKPKDVATMEAVSTTEAAIATTTKPVATKPEEGLHANGEETAFLEEESNGNVVAEDTNGEAAAFLLEESSTGATTMTILPKQLLKQKTKARHCNALWEVTWYS